MQGATYCVSVHICYYQQVDFKNLDYRLSIISIEEITEI